MTWLRASTTAGGAVLQAADVGALTDSTGGTPDRGINSAGGAYNQAGQNNTLASLADYFGDVRTALRDAEAMA